MRKVDRSSADTSSGSTGAAAGAAGVAPVIATTGHTGRRRRPSGEAPPLPRHVDAATRWCAAAVLAVVPLEVVLAVPGTRAVVTRLDDAAVRALAHLRPDAVVTLARGLQGIGSAPAVRVVGWATIGVLLLARRWRHLLVYLGLLMTVVLVVRSLDDAQGRMRPAGVRILGDWTGYAHPALPVATVAAVIVGLALTAVPRGRPRRAVLAAGAAAVGLLCAADLLLAVDHPTDVLAALALGWALPVLGYHLLVPEEAFPVRYDRRRPAHLDVGGARGAAIVRALDGQLGLTVHGVHPFGQAGSAGSTPLRIELSDREGNRRSVFAKLYAVNHLRADRSYKLVRMVLYGRLEDEKPFSTVRRLVEYEDHMLRLLRDADLPVPEPLGLVEITPEREYLVLMSLIDGAHEVGSQPAGQDEIDDALSIVRRLWRAGVAHRDIKPSNLLARGGRVFLIDVAFATVRPTPWRQAVDLANMMLTVALPTSAEAVYARAVRQFAPEDVAEAFAATRSITVPTQLRARLRADDRDLIGRFRALAPQRPAVPIQLWSIRRVAVTALVLVGGVVAATAVYAYARLAGLL